MHQAIYTEPVKKDRKNSRIRCADRKDKENTHHEQRKKTELQQRVQGESSAGSTQERIDGTGTCNKIQCPSEPDQSLEKTGGGNAAGII